ncbi:MAG: hypothetical protein QIT46_gp14 [Methanophagales virus PBV305]|uniref:Uncharacterized protein n=1 Tax=Methanophagales virus PBV305 TaxID=3071310 RepID=A0AA46YJA2_9VIRU|nr:MAG: hypothetical protein QIT46_gp14 [Methanophagales virus PBV305]UYL65066.1 MAG: hypothetical protein HJKPNNFO_00014 [Methanophagales virus PBV305]
MVKLRNAGFERGDAEFWEALVGSNLIADNSKASRGTYSGRITADGSGSFKLRHKDYIPIERGEVIHLEAEVYPNGTGTGFIEAYYYDEEFDEIDSDNQQFGITNGQWNKLEGDFIPQAGAKYLRVAIKGSLLNSNANNWIDNVLLEIYTPQSCLFRHVTLYDSGSSTITSSGNSAGYYKGMIGMREYYAQMTVDWDGSDSDETITVEIHDKSEYSNEDEVVGVFTQVKAEDGHERIQLANVTGKKLYVKWTVGGTTPKWKNLKVEIWGVR